LELVGTVLSESPRANYRSINYRTDRVATDGEVEAGSDAADVRFVSVESVRDGYVDVRKLGRLRLRDVRVLE
jgi:8-oxo-dGTP diphosphatase